MEYRAVSRDVLRHSFDPRYTGQTQISNVEALADPNPDISTDASGRLFGRFWSGYLRKHLGLLLIAVVFMLIEGSTLGALSYLLQPMFDLVFVEGRESAIWFVGASIFALFAIRAVSGVLQRGLMANISFRASTALQFDLMNHAVELDHSFHSTTSPGALIERVQGDVTSIQSLWNIIITGAGRDIVALFSLLGVAVLIDWRWTLVAIIGAPLLLLPSLAVQRYVRRKSFFIRELAARRTTQLDEVFHGITPIKLNRLEDYQAERFHELSKTLVNANFKVVTGQATVPGLVDIAVGLGFFCVLIFGGPEIIAGEKTIGQFMSFFTAMALAFQPMRRLGSVMGYWQVMQASLSRIFGLLDVQPKISDAPGTDFAATPATTEITFEDVSLAYGDLPVLNGLSFDLPSGQTTALVGASGAGKSTVFNVLTRLFDPNTGTVKIGGTSVQDLKLGDLRDLFSVVSQDALLFDETLRENIVAGREDVTEEQLQAALDTAHVSDFLDDLPNGLETQVGARGSNLSGGQRQRVAIARAVLRDTPILLLDEATSALDAESETVVQKALDKLSEGRTTLVIAHRLSTVRNADQILVLDKGQLIERGSHDQLLAKGGAYAHLHDLQFQSDKRPFMDVPNAPGMAQDFAPGWRPLSAGETGRDTEIDAQPFGSFAPNLIQRGLIALGKATFLKRGIARGRWTKLIIGLGASHLDIRFRDAAYRITGRNNLIEYNLLLNAAYNGTDIEFLLEGATQDAQFLDIGSNIGLYALTLAKARPSGHVLAIDANIDMVEQLSWNAQASGLGNVTVVNAGVSDSDSTGELSIRKSDTAIVSVTEAEDGSVRLRPLLDILSDHDITEIYGLKIDIEGHEDQALVPFFTNAPKALLPKRIVIETLKGGTDYPGCTEAFAKHGYRLISRTKNNSLYLRD